MNKNNTKLFGLQIFNRSRDDFLVFLEKKIKKVWAKDARLVASITPIVVFTPNAEQIVQAQKDPYFKKNLQQADVLIPDGMSLVWASRLLAKRKGWGLGIGSDTRNVCGKIEPIKERIAGVDVVKDLLCLAQKNEWKVLVVGGRDLGKKYVGVSVYEYVWAEGYKDITQPTKEEEQKLTQFIKKLKPQIVFVAFGAPWQEKWVMENRDLLANNGVRLAMVVGGAFDFITGKVARAPQCIQKIGLEWFFRLWQEPWRWKRQLRLVEFWWLVVWDWGLEIRD